MLLSELKTWFEDFFKIPGAKEGSFGGSIGFVWASLLGEEVFSLLVKIGYERSKDKTFFYVKY